MENQPIKQAQSSNNLADKRSFILILFAAAIIFFFFNFFTISCGDEKVKEVKGIDLVIGSDNKDQPISSENGFSFDKTLEDEKVPTNIWAIIALGAAIIGFGAFLIKEKREAYIGAGAGTIGAASLLILQNVVKETIEGKAEGAPIKIEFQFAYWAALIAMGIAAYISYLRLQKGKNVTIKATPQVSNVQTTSPQQIVETANSSPERETFSTPANPIQQVQTETIQEQQQNSFDTSEWIKRNKLVVASLLIAGLAGYGLYYFVLRNDPIKDGKKVAIDKCDCVDEYQRAKINTLQDFTQKFDTYKFKSRQVAKATLDTLMTTLSKNYQKCLEKTDSIHKKLIEKYAIDKGEKEKFDFAFNAQKEFCNNTQREQLLDELDKLAQKQINTIIGLSEKIDRLLATQYGNRYLVLTDSNNDFEKYEMDQFIKPERKNNEYYPYVVNGDFNGDGFMDNAALVQDRRERGYFSSRLAIIWGDDNSMEINDEGCSAIYLSKGGRTIQGMDEAPTYIKNDAIGVVCFEKSSWILYWDGTTFKKVWTGD